MSARSRRRSDVRNGRVAAESSLHPLGGPSGSKPAAGGKLIGQGGRLVAVAVSKIATTLHGIAVGYMQLARGLAEEGYDKDDMAYVRDAAGKSWFAVIQATDAAMERRGLVPEPGVMAEASRHEFLKVAGRADLKERLDEFERLLDAKIAYFGEVPERARMAAVLEEAAEYIRCVGEDL